MEISSFICYRSLYIYAMNLVQLVAWPLTKTPTFFSKLPLIMLILTLVFCFVLFCCFFFSVVFRPCCPLRDYSWCMVLFHHQVQQSNDLPSHCVTGVWLFRHARECTKLCCRTHWRQQSEFTHLNAEEKDDD